MGIFTRMSTGAYPTARWLVKIIITFPAFGQPTYSFQRLTQKGPAQWPAPSKAISPRTQLFTALLFAALLFAASLFAALLFAASLFAALSFATSLLIGAFNGLLSLLKPR